MIGSVQAIESAIERVLTVRLLSPFAELSPGSAAAVARRTAMERLPAGTTLRHGSSGKEAHLVLSGQLAYRRQGQAAEDVGPGDVAGLIDLLALKSPPATLTALEDSTVLVLSADAIEDLCEDDFGMFAGLLGWVSRLILRRVATLPGGSRVDDLRPVEARPAVLGPPLARRIEAFAAFDAFRADQLDAISEISRQSIDVSTSDGDTLWLPGQEASSFLLVLRGEVRCQTPSGWHSHSGGPVLVGELEALGGISRRFEASAVGDLIALQISSDAFLDILEDHPLLARHFLARQAERLLGLALG